MEVIDFKTRKKEIEKARGHEEPKEIIDRIKKELDEGRDPLSISVLVEDQDNTVHWYSSHVDPITLLGFLHFVSISVFHTDFDPNTKSE